MVIGFIKIFILFFCFSAGITRYETLKEDPKCSDCHKTLIEQPVAHPPVEDCASCHQSGGQQHPVAGVKTFTLIDAVPKLCYSCHEEGKKTVKHAPAASGECFSCHIPHNSPNKSLLTENKVSALCLTCHDLKTAADKSIHKPVTEGTCTGCHDPHQSDLARLVKNKQPELCFTCHEKTKTQASLKNIHPPFESECSSCHKPHSAAEQKLLVSKAPDLCYECHSDFKEKVEKYKFKHSPVSTGKSCVSCHSPHASNENKFLVSDQKTLCLNCHNKKYISKTDKHIIPDMKKLISTAKSVHAAVDDGCTGCHNAHGSDFENLLISSFPQTMYVVSTPDNFGLCFTCHDKELIEKENTTSTQFRNGEKNMHYLHVNGIKGRNCTVCHNVHASANTHLINEKMKFGTYDFNLNYESSENGGSCATACHGEKNYDRLTSFDNKKKRITASVKKKDKVAKNDSLKSDTLSGVITSKEKIDTINIAENKNKEKIIEDRESNSKNENSVEKRNEDEKAAKEKEKRETREKSEADAKKKIEEKNKDEAESREQFEAEQKAFEKEKVKMNVEKEKKEKLASEALAKIESELKKKIDAENRKKKRLEDVSKNLPVDKKREAAMIDSVFASITNDLMMEARLDSMLESKLPKIQINEFKFLKSLELTIDFNKTQLISGKEAELIYVIEFLKNYTERKVEIQGHTDNKGSEETNMELSLKRAEYVRDYLVSKGIKASQITVIGHGYTRPKDTNDTEQGRAKNRRIEFRLIE